MALETLRIAGWEVAGVVETATVSLSHDVGQQEAFSRGVFTHQAHHSARVVRIAMTRSHVRLNVYSPSLRRFHKWGI